MFIDVTLLSAKIMHPTRCNKKVWAPNSNRCNTRCI